MFMKRIIFLSVLVLLVTGGLLFAQSSTSSGGRGGAKTFDLTITSNVGSAQVFINGAAQNNKGMPFTASGLAGGSYNVVVKAPGYQDGSASVNLTANQTVTINLNSMTAALT
ncbi:MAG: PEGA domain-containing protein, partial [Spirochaetales bacterium]